MPLSETQLQILCDIAEAAGREIMAVYHDGGETWHKDDQSPLTEAPQCQTTCRSPPEIVDNP